MKPKWKISTQDNTKQEPIEEIYSDTYILSHFIISEVFENENVCIGNYKLSQKNCLVYTIFRTETKPHYAMQRFGTKNSNSHKDIQQ